MGQYLLKYKYEAVLVLLSLVFLGVFFSLRVLQYQSFFSYEWEDDARENQVVYNIAVSNTPHQTIYQTTPPKLFNDHFSPIYYVLALFYKINPHIYTWYFLMCASYAFSSLVVFRIAGMFLKNPRLPFLVTVIYFLYPPLHYTTLGTLDPRNFLLPLFFLIFLFIYRKNFAAYLVCMILACLCKEDVPLYFFSFGVYLFWKKYPKKWWITTLSFSFVYFIVSLVLTFKYCQIDHSTTFLADEFDYDYINRDSIVRMLTDVSRAEFWRGFFSWPKIRFFAMTLFPLVFIPFFAIEYYIAFWVVLIEVFVPQGFSNQGSYYIAPMIPFMFLSLIFVLRRLGQKVHGKLPIILCGVLIAHCLMGTVSRNIIGPTAKEYDHGQEYGEAAYDGIPINYDRSFYGVMNIFHPLFYRKEEDDRQAWELLNKIPGDASLMVSGDLLPAASSRRYVFEFGLNEEIFHWNETALLGQREYSAEYILINRKCKLNKLGGHYACIEEDRLEAVLGKIEQQFRYKLLDEKGPFLLYRKTE